MLRKYKGSSDAIANDISATVCSFYATVGRGLNLLANKEVSFFLFAG
jgi:hypothetical protein